MEIVLSIIFFGVLGTNAICCVKKYRRACFITKLMLVPLLLAFYILKNSVYDIFIVFALLFSFFGDVLLEWSNRQKLFFAGLFSFLVAHIFYGIAFLKDTHWLQNVPDWVYFSIFLYVGYGLCVTFNLSIKCNTMKIAVAIYCMILLLMSFLSLTRVGIASGYAFWLPLVGTLFFIASDSLLAFNRFKHRTPNGSAYIMVTYGIAQFLLIAALNSY